MAASWAPKQYHDGPELSPAVPERQPGLEVAQPMYGAYMPPPRTQHDSGASGGFRRATWILSIILAVVIIGAAVGGGVGGSMCANNAKNSNCVATTVTATPSPGGSATAGQSSTSTTSAGASSPTTGSFVPPTNVNLLLDCPSINNTRWPVTLGASTWTFAPYCGADYLDSGTTDIIAVITYTFHDCLQACASRNRNTGSNSCVGVVFNSRLQSSVASNYGTCFLKPSMKTPILGGGNAYAAASLV